MVTDVSNNDGMKKFQFKNELIKLFNFQQLAALATLDNNGPYINLVAFATTDDLKYILFSTSRSTKKYANISKNPDVTMLIDNRKNDESDFYDTIAVTAMGQVNQVNESEIDKLTNIFISKHPILSDFLKSQNNVFLKIKVKKYIIVSTFGQVNELNLKEIN